MSRFRPNKLYYYHMPRRNNTPKHIPYHKNLSPNEATKRKFKTKHDAEQAIKELQKYHLDIDLKVYKSEFDGAWYLTSSH